MKTLNTYVEEPVLSSKMGERYAELCALRDKVYAATAPLQAKLDDANARCEAARVEAAALAEQIEVAWGKEKWIALKKEIGVLAKALNGRR
jgi:hypothetical protein